MKKLEQSITGVADFSTRLQGGKGPGKEGYSLGEPRTTTGVAILVLSPGGPAWSQAAERGEQVQLSALWFRQ